MDIFGWKFNRKDEEQKKENVLSPIPPSNDDGSLVVTEGGVFGTYVNMDGSARTEAELVTKYREIAEDHNLDMAIDEIVNEAIVEDAEEPTVDLVLDEITDLSSGIKSKINDEFQEILSLIDFNNHSYEIFRQWYVDGRIYYHAMIDQTNPRKGLQEVRYIDPRNVRKIRKVKTETDQKVNAPVQKIEAEFFMYNPTGFNKEKSPHITTTTQQGIKLSNDAVVYVTSGILNAKGDMVLSYLHKAIRPLNQLKSLEDATVIYRISRAPERRIFYIDVGNLPKMKADQYVKDIMTKFKNRIVYDSATGEIRDDRKFMTMLEDFWLPRREGTKGTEISTLPGGQNLGEMDDVEYFQRNLYKALNVPISRLQPETVYSLGRATEITRDEVKFGKFITRLRSKFSTLFLQLLKKQLILKGIITIEDWDGIADKINFRYAHDNYFEEMKQMEVMRDRMSLLNEMVETVGKYYSHDYIMRSILHMTDDEIKTQRKLIEKEKKDKILNPPEDDGMGMDDDGGDDSGNDYKPEAKPDKVLDIPREKKDDVEKESEQKEKDREKRRKEIQSDYTPEGELISEKEAAELELTYSLINFVNENRS